MFEKDRERAGSEGLQRFELETSTAVIGGVIGVRPVPLGAGE